MPVYFLDKNSILTLVCGGFEVEVGGDQNIIGRIGHKLDAKRIRIGNIALELNH